MSQEFEFTEELVELRAMVRKFCQELSSEETVRETMETGTGHDPALWSRIGTELDVIGLAVPAAYGGAGAGLVAQAVVVEEMGAALLCGPVLGTLALAVPALCALGDDGVKRDLLPALVAGEKVATVAAPLGDGGYDASAVTVEAAETGGAWTVSGVVEHVPDGGTADVVLVAARTGAGVALFAVDGAETGIGRDTPTTLDLTRRQATLSLAVAPARRIADESEAAGVLEHTARVGCVLLAVEQVGGSQAMLDKTVAHVAERKQFGQAVGAFQAVKHRCANMLIAVEQARSAAYHGAWALEDGSDDPRLAASLAKAVASEAYSRISADAIQLHGGIGFSWEHPAHLYLKRAVTDSATLGAPEQHFERVAQYALGPPGA